MVTFLTVVSPLPLNIYEESPILLLNVISVNSIILGQYAKQYLIEVPFAKLTLFKIDISEIEVL